MSFTVRQYRSPDFPTLWKIDQSCFPTGISYTRFELKTYINRPGAFALVAQNDAAGLREPAEGSKAESDEIATIVGFLVAEQRRRSGHIITIDVRAQARRLGVGSALLASAESRMRLWNCDVVRLETAVDNVAALSFYKRYGYDVVKVVPRYYSNGVDALLLEKNLHSAPPSDNLLE